MEEMTVRKTTLAALVVCLSLSAGSVGAQMDEKARDTIPGPPLGTPTDVEMYTGTNVGGPEWDRPFLDCSLSTFGPVRYSDQAFYVDMDGICDISSAQEYDGYLHLYVGSWDPIDSCTNLIDLNDDGSGGIGTSEIFGVAVTGGTPYWIVTSAYAAGQEGTFQNTISCDVDATLGLPVPTMSGPWMAAFILVLLAGGLLITRFRLG
jgi:hypothetical protein